MAKGRKRKGGNRERNGRLQRLPADRYDKGNERIAAMRERFGEHYNSAIGRAFAGGLLGDDTQAKVRLDTGKRFARLYSAVIALPAYTCPLAREIVSGGASSPIYDEQRAKDDQDWLFAMMAKLDREGLRPWLDQLISPVHTDEGPYWLDALLNGGKHPADRAVLNEAIKALDCIAPKVRQVGIRVAA